MALNRRIVFKYTVSTALLVVFAFLFFPFYSELLLAAIVAFAMGPSLGRVFDRKHFKWKASVALILFGLFLAVAAPICYVLYRTYRFFVKMSETGIQNSEVFQKLTAVKEKLVAMVDRASSTLNIEWQFELSSSIDEWMNSLFETIVRFSTTLVAHLPSLLISIFVFCAALYYFLAEARSLKSAFMKQRLLLPAEANRLIGVLQSSCYGTVVASLVIATLQATIVAIGSVIFDTGDWAVVWVVTFFFAFIPIIGAGPVALAMGVYQLLMGDYGAAVGFLIVAVVAGTSDNLARTFLISSGQEDLHPVVLLLAIVGALLVFGMPGLFLGPVVATVAIKIIPTLFDPTSEKA